MLLNINPGFCDNPKITRFTYVLRVFSLRSSWGQHLSINSKNINWIKFLFGMKTYWGMTKGAFENRHRSSLNIHDADDHFSLLTDGRMLQFQTALV